MTQYRRAITRVRQYPPKSDIKAILGWQQFGEDLEATLKSVQDFERRLARKGGDNEIKDPTEYIQIETLEMPS